MSGGNQSGTTTGYKAQWRREGKEKWKDITWEKLCYPRGAILESVPFPALYGGILSTVYLMGKAQAQAVAWGFVADWEATQFSTIEVRILAYEVKYSIEYRPKDESEKELKGEP